MAVQIGSKGQSGFDDPLGLLEDCHRRIERFLQVLLEVSRRAHGGALSAEQRTGLEAAVQYFRQAGPKHMADEEQSLFPRMRRCGDEEAHAVLDALEELEQDHVSAQVGHDRVEQLVGQWLRQGGLPPHQAQELLGTLERLRELYHRHIELEDHRVFPLAAKVLPAEELRALGDEMAGRRGVRRGKDATAAVAAAPSPPGDHTR